MATKSELKLLYYQERLKETRADREEQRVWSREKAQRVEDKNKYLEDNGMGHLKYKQWWPPITTTVGYTKIYSPLERAYWSQGATADATIYAFKYKLIPWFIFMWLLATYGSEEWFRLY